MLKQFDDYGAPKEAWSTAEGFDVVILCGGLGTRMREETEFKPKPMVEIGGKPII
ncbi:MAG: hypothetical protein IIA72_05515, partial [Proteobacteria bacterium]|nr:hypothetical protein [Pseudomonadota bacterium]